MKGRLMIATHIAALVVGAFTVLVVQQLRIDKIEARHKLAVATLVQEHETAAKKQREQALKDQARITDNYQGALNASRIRETSLRADAGHARAAAERLRKQARTAASRIHLPETAPAAIADYAVASGELLAECSRAYQELGEKADGHVSDLQTLSEAWPAQEPSP